MKTQVTERSERNLLSEFDPPPLFMEDAEYCIYVIQSKKDKSIYFGYTNDLKRRFKEHNKGLCPSTKDKIPYRMVFYEGYSSEKDARARERRLKQFKNAYKELLKRIENCLEQ